METMKCRHVQNNLIGYMENALSPSLMHDVEGHLEVCEVCRILNSKVKSTYFALDTYGNKVVPDLFPKIEEKLKHHHTTIVEFVPQHKIIFRIAASIIIILGISLGILVGGKYTSAESSLSQTVSQDEGTEYYSTVVNPMDGESGLAILYTNE